MKVAQIVERTEAEGPGQRYAIWFQGCVFRCPGCCNPEFLSFHGGKEMSLDDISFPPDIEGITIMGGEPFAHLEDCIFLVNLAKQNNLSVMIFSGYTLEEIKTFPNTDQVLSKVDILIDGKYIKDQPDNRRRWIGSTNQKIHFLTDRYDLSYFEEKNTLEIRMIDGEIIINGFPDQKAKSLWKPNWKRISLK